MDTNYKIVCGAVCLVIGGIIVYRRRKVIPIIPAKDLDDELNAILRQKAIRITGHKF